MSTLFSIKARVSGLGVVGHMVRDKSQIAAWEKFCRAYPNRECDLLSINKAIGWPSHETS